MHFSYKTSPVCDPNYPCRYPSTIRTLGYRIERKGHSRKLVLFYSILSILLSDKPKEYKTLSLPEEKERG